MINLSSNKIRVRCIECKEEHFIEIKNIFNDKMQRSLGYEYEHEYAGELQCSKCNDLIKIKLTIFEYPKDWINYIDIGEEGCLIMNKIEHSENNVIITDNKSISIINSDII